MTKRIIYAGKSDIRQVSVADLKLAGVEDETDLKARQFQRNVPVEVSETLFAALVTDEAGLFAGGFKRAPKLAVAKDDDEEELEEEPKSKKSSAKSGSVSTTENTPTSGGNGSSTP